MRDLIGDVKVVFWVCPIRDHGKRRNERGMPVVTVEWVDGIAHCTDSNCTNTSEKK